MIRALHHVGIAVEDLDAAIAFYERTFDLLAEPVLPPAGSELRFALIRLPGTEIELLASSTPTSVIGKFLAKRGPGVHHLAFLVDDIRGAMATTKHAGVAALQADPVPGVEGTSTCFFHPAATLGVLIEYVQTRALEGS